MFHCLHIREHFLPEDFSVLEAAFLNVMNSPSIGGIAGAVQTNSRLYDNVTAYDTAKYLHGIINIEFLTYQVRQIPLVINIFLHMFTFWLPTVLFFGGREKWKRAQSVTDCNLNPSGASILKSSTIKQ